MIDTPVDVAGVISLVLIVLWSLKVIIQVQVHRACSLCRPDHIKRGEDKR